MRAVKYLVFLLCVLSVVAMAADNTMGIREVNNVTFSSPIRIGTTVLPEGKYVVRHKMDGQEHLMVFQLERSAQTFTTKCTLVPLPKKAEQTQSVYEVTASNDRVLKELVFRGDTAKHVF